MTCPAVIPGSPKTCPGSKVNLDWIWNVGTQETGLSNLKKIPIMQFKEDPPPNLDLDVRGSAQTSAAPVVSPPSYQLCEYVTASHNDFLSHSSAQNTFLNGSFISIPHGSKVTLVQQRQGWTPPSIFINVTSQWPVTSLLLIAFSIVPFAETPTMWVSSIFGNKGGLAHSTWGLVWLHGAVGALCTIMLEDEAAFKPKNTCRKY